MLRASYLNRVLPVAATLALLGCEPEITNPNHPATAGTMSLIIVSGNNQTGPAGQRLPLPLVVKVVGAGNIPVKGQHLNWVITAGGGEVFAGASLTNAQGIAKELWTLGTVAGVPQTLEVRAVNPSTGAPQVFGRFTATAVPGAAATVDVSPDSIGLDLGESTQLTATAADQYGNPIANPAISWSSNDPSVATVDQAGLVTGVANGKTIVTAAVGVVTGSAVVSVDDGNWIAFVSRRHDVGDGNDEIYLMRPDGSQQTRITNQAGYDWSPDFSPDRKRIAFSRGPDAFQTVWIMNRDGSGQTQLTFSGDAGDPDWSPDGTQIVYSNMPTCGNIWCGVGLFRINADGAGLTQLTAGTDSWPAWSPDGQRIAFSRMVAANTNCFWDIFIMNADGSNITRLTNTGGSCGSGFAGHPAWSPDGQWIAFTSQTTGNTEIYKMRPDGSNMTQLTFNGANEDVPTWSPDGIRIAFQSDRFSAGLPDIFIMDAAGGNEVRLTTDPAVDMLPRWF